MVSQEAIVCVDDEGIILLDLISRLRKHFHDRFVYSSATSAKEGLQVIAGLITEGVRVILIISDWQMPGMNGREFLAEVEKTHPGIQAVLMSAYPEAWLEKQVKEVDIIRACFSKPIKMPSLIRFIESIHLDLPTTGMTCTE